MSLVICNGGKVSLLQQLKTYLNGLTLRLYQNAHTPGIGDTASSYVEASFTGYGAVALTTFGNAFLNTSNFGETDATAVTFTQTGVTTTNTIYGYYLTDSGGNLIWAELNPNGSFQMNAIGLTYTVQPVLTSANVGGT